MSIEIVTEKDRIYREFLQKRHEEEQKQEQERKAEYNRLMDVFSKKVLVRSQNLGGDEKRQRDAWFNQVANERGYDVLPISDVLSRYKDTIKAIEDKDLEMDRLVSGVYDDVYTECSDEGYATRFVRDVFQGLCPKGYEDTRALYKKLDEELLELQIDLEAYNGCKQAYIKANEDLINAERERVRKETLLNSGILEELGIVPTKQETEETTPQEETFAGAIHDIVND